MSDFQDFWAIYPRRVAKRAAQKAWDKEMKAGTDPDSIIAGLRRQIPIFARKDEQFIPHASTWIHSGRWEDEVSLPVPSRGQERPGDMADYLNARKANRDARTIDGEYERTSDRGPASYFMEDVAFSRRH